jgi:hypothetical protein
MTTHNSGDDIKRYEQKLCSSFQSSTLIVKEGTPLGACAVQANEMIDSYLHDAAYFAKHDDLVNWLASLGYAHGWLSGAVLLGYVQAEFFDIPEVSPFNSRYHSKLHEKKERYDMMLVCALHSIHIAPMSGSPLGQAADEFYRKIESDLFYSRTQSEENALLTVSYAYGVLDFGIRAGLYQIVDQPHLFTTDV